MEKFTGEYPTHIANIPEDQILDVLRKHYRKLHYRMDQTISTASASQAIDSIPAEVDDSSLWRHGGNTSDLRHRCYLAELALELSEQNRIDEFLEFCEEVVTTANKGKKVRKVEDGPTSHHDFQGTTMVDVTEYKPSSINLARRLIENKYSQEISNKL